MFGILMAFYVLMFQIKRHSFDDVREEYFINKLHQQIQDCVI